LKYVRKFFIIRECKKFQSNAIFKNFKTFSLVDEMIYAAHQEMEKLFQETFVLPLKPTQKKRRMAADAFPAHPPYTHTHTHTCVLLVAYEWGTEIYCLRRPSGGNKLVYVFPFTRRSLEQRRPQGHALSVAPIFWTGPHNQFEIPGTLNNEISIS